MVAPIGGPHLAAIVTCGLVLLTYDTWRTMRPLDLRPIEVQVGDASSPRATRRATAPMWLDVAVAVAAVVATGCWRSPYVFCILPGVVAIGISRAYGPAVRTALLASAVVSVAAVATASDVGAQLQAAGQWVIELVLVAVLAGYTRRLFGDAERRHSETLDRVGRLVEANELLVSLHRLAQQLPASLNLETVLASTVSRLRSMIESDVAAVVLHDDTSSGWTVAAGEGTHVGRTFAEGDLPAALSSVASSSVASLVVCLGPGDAVGSELLSHTGLYAPLRARGALIGLIALEHHAPGSYGRRELQLLDGFVETAALAIDNARWFGRLRSIGAQEERVRIARDMHDRLGQSLASVGFGLDLVRRQLDDDNLKEEVDRLRAEVRTAVSEVRETLGDLRTDVADTRGLDVTLEGFLERVEMRAGLAVNFTHHQEERLPLIQEREIWRIAQEAITNVERHAGAEHLSVRWDCDRCAAVLVVADDGSGFDPRRCGRPDSYGITGMKERAEAIGASLQIDSAAGAGTVVRCVLERS